MTAPLTLDDASATDVISFPTTPADMSFSGFQSARGTGRLNGTRSGSMTGNGYTPVTASWRREQPIAASAPSNNHQTSFDRQRRGSTYAEDEPPVPLSTVKPGTLWPSDAQMTVAYTYGIRRADGVYTMLAPVDELDRFDFRKIPTTQGAEGMIVLPPLTVERPEDRGGKDRMVPAKVSSNWYSINSNVYSHLIDCTISAIEPALETASQCPRP